MSRDIKLWIKDLKSLVKREGGKQDKDIVKYLVNWCKGDAGAKNSFTKLYYDYAVGNKNWNSFEFMVNVIHDHVLDFDYESIYWMINSGFRYNIEEWYKENNGVFGPLQLVGLYLKSVNFKEEVVPDVIVQAADNVYNKNIDIAKRFNNRFICSGSVGVSSGAGECKIKELL
jgi:hypothetical protein